MFSELMNVYPKLQMFGPIARITSWAGAIFQACSITVTSRGCISPDCHSTRLKKIIGIVPSIFLPAAVLEALIMLDRPISPFLNLFLRYLTTKLDWLDNA